ncbi:MAG: hypothetical protein R3F59_25845 [Myxococcota bacterium]
MRPVLEDVRARGWDAGKMRTPLRGSAIMPVVLGPRRCARRPSPTTSALLERTAARIRAFAEACAAALGADLAVPGGARPRYQPVDAAGAHAPAGASCCRRRC